MATKDNDKSSGKLKIRGGKKIAEEIKEKRQECFDRIKDKNYEHIL